MNSLAVPTSWASTVLRLSAVPMLSVLGVNAVSTIRECGNDSLTSPALGLKEKICCSAYAEKNVKVLPAVC